MDPAGSGKVSADRCFRVRDPRRAVEVGMPVEVKRVDHAFCLAGSPEFDRSRADQELSRSKEK